MSDSSSPSALLRRLGRRVRERRAALRWTRAELARRSGLSPRFLADLEAGRGNISVARLERLALALSLPPARLLEAEAEFHAPPAKLTLVGLRGAGKTTLGRLAARRLGWPFVEVDQRVEEAAGMSLADLFGLHGEPYYRALERRLVRETIEAEGPALLAVSGGVVTDAETWQLLKARTRTVWLSARPEDHFRRVLEQGDRRPMEGNPRARAELEALLAVREPLYAEADARVETDRLGLEGAVEALVAEARRLFSPPPPPRSDR